MRFVTAYIAMKSGNIVSISIQLLGNSYTTICLIASCFESQNEFIFDTGLRLCLEDCNFICFDPRGKS